MRVPASCSTNSRRAAASALWPSYAPYELQDQGRDTIEANLELGYEADCRHFELPAQILKQMGVESVRLITNNPEKVEALELAGIKVIERISAEVPSEPTNERYLQTKREKMGHLVS